MKESKMWEIKEWAESKGLSVVDYYEAAEAMSEHKQLMFAYGALLVSVIVLGVYAVVLESRYDAAIATCLRESSSIANLTIDQASAVCSKLMGW